MNSVLKRLGMVITGAFLLLFTPSLASAIVSSNADSTSVFNGVNINQLIGAETFYNHDYWGTRATIANVEAGFIWKGHDTLGNVSAFIAEPSILAAMQYDYHATMVGEVLAGNLPQIDVDFGGIVFTIGAPYTYWLTGKIGTMPFNASSMTGIAPSAQLWSAAIATSWNYTSDHSQEYVGSFNITPESLSYAYTVSMLTGKNGKTADVINSSWGDSSTHDGSSFYTKIIDALAYSTHKIVVMAAGNDAEQTGEPAAGYNGISVAATSSDTSSPVYSSVSPFSSGGPIPFYNPQTGVTTANARVGVDIAAPGDNLTLAFYGGLTGGHDPLYYKGAKDPTGGSGGYFFIDVSGTSFASPTVAGGAALVVDVGKDKFSADAHAIDARVVKAVLLNSADKPTGWNNGQTNIGGVVTTKQALDYTVGAGLLNLDRAYSQYTAGTTDVASLTGGTVSSVGWAFGHVDTKAVNDYYIAKTLSGGTLSVTLSWFVDRVMDEGGVSASDVKFSDLDLEVLRIVNSTTTELVAESSSDYNNIEHLYLDIPEEGQYLLRVLFDGEVYNLGGVSSGEDYGLAWYYAVPEPSVFVLFAGIVPVLFLFRRKR